jgi:glycosyltransferase involved in cell wall biosynthesis
MFVEEKVSLLLPVHNEAETIERVIRDFYEEINGKVPLEIVVAEDGSTDGTKDVLQKLSSEIPMTIVMDDQRKGYMGGLRNGLAKVTGNYVLFCDADGQHYPSDFWTLYEGRNGFDIVSGWRVRRADSFFRRITSKLFQRLARMMFNLPVLHDLTAPYRLVKTDVAQKISKEIQYMVESYWTEFTIRACAMGTRITEIPVQHRLRLNGSTRVYRLSKLPRIAYSQLLGLFKIKRELGKKD